MTDGQQKIRCAYDGCWRTTARPYADGWSNLSGWGHVKDGFYCRPHADALESIHMDGEDFGTARGET